MSNMLISSLNAIDVHVHITPERCLRDFDALDIKPDVRPKILKDNAVRLLGLASD